MELSLLRLLTEHNLELVMRMAEVAIQITDHRAESEVKRDADATEQIEQQLAARAGPITIHDALHLLTQHLSGGQICNNNNGPNEMTTWPAHGTSHRTLQQQLVAIHATQQLIKLVRRQQKVEEPSMDIRAWNMVLMVCNESTICMHASFSACGWGQWGYFGDAWNVRNVADEQLPVAVEERKVSG